MNLTQERELVLLLSLVELSGQGTKQEVLDHIANRDYLRLDAADKKILASRNELAWRNALAFLRHDLTEAGHLDGSNRNIWAITPTGRERFAKLSLQVLSSQVPRKLTLNAVAALNRLNPTRINILPEEVQDDRGLKEGATRQITVNAYERNSTARKLCLAYYGTDCVICGCGLGARYGTQAEGYIHVHHLRQLSEIGEEYEVDPIVDLRPVCPNCHAVIHLTNPPYTIDEVKVMLLSTN